MIAEAVSNTATRLFIQAIFYRQRMHYAAHASGCRMARSCRIDPPAIATHPAGPSTKRSFARYPNGFERQHMLLVQERESEMRYPDVGHLRLLIVALAAGHFGVGASAARAQGYALPCPLTAPYRTDNPFARIIRGELPASIVAEDKRVIAIIPLEWEYPGHTLVIPKAAVRNLDDLSDRDALAVMHMVKRIAAAQQRALGSTGYSLQQNNASRQDICHFHVHVIPNTPAVVKTRATRAEMDAMAAKLRAALSPQ